MHFVVVSEPGPAWVAGRPMREQDGWPEHAAFMNALAAERFVLLGGPLHGGPTHRALLVVAAPDESTARRRLGEDPWRVSGILRVRSFEPWEIILGDPP
jgi:uncharacterized protein YciI